ncbi:LysR family transcriptional regulator [Marinobacter oulmenensis]|uniref:DNA-binding transcriptional LysR family regulator n=1 Tax=Marinobacter oulmenensis TaxID=643747 RepID=A0A840UG86_9GAMM|nr:LysR family transcriptional regulator [Marinobacter oulmenensis]MBB5321731.1 DNA-binding transcriptional LysR family regulator [Marinobacter oulmenensis]
MQRVIPNLRHLRVFLEVARQRSISKAAPLVFLSQPAITQAIGKLESLLETELFERHSNGMFLTTAGRVWNTRVLRCIDYLERGIRLALRGSAGQPGATTLLPLLTTTQLRALIAVTENHSFSVASRQLELSQSSLHRASRELEELLGIVLFEKARSSILPTRAAEQLARAAKLAFGEIEQGYYEILALQSREVGKITIGSMPLARTSILPDVINRFTLAHPDIGLDVVDAPYNDLLFHLRNGDLDLLIGALRFPPPADDIVQEELISPPLAIVGRKDHPLHQAKSLTLEQLVDYGWVVPRKGTPTRTFFDTLFTDEGLPTPLRLVETSSQILIRSLLSGSDRLTLISTHQVEQELRQNVLSVIPYDLSHTRRPIGITVRRDWHPTPTQKHFLDLLKAAASRYQAG